MAIAMLQAMESQTAQRSVIRAAAAQILTKDDLRLFDAVTKAAVPSRRVRHGFAHNIWGVSAQLPDALLLLDTKHHNTSLAAYQKWRLEKTKSGREAGPQPDVIDRSKVYVWHAKDLTQAHMAALRASSNFILLNALASADFSGCLAASIRQQLLNDSAVQLELQPVFHAGTRPTPATTHRATGRKKSSSSRPVREMPRASKDQP